MLQQPRFVLCFFINFPMDTDQYEENKLLPNARYTEPYSPFSVADPFHFDTDPDPDSDPT